MLADRPLDDEGDDRFGFRDYADALAELIDHPDTYTPLTIAISAPWGAGKTSLAHLIERRLKTWRRDWGQPPHIVCWFNAWAHDDATHLGAAFAAVVARKVDRERPWWQRLRSPLPAAMLTPRRRWRRRILLASVALAVAVGLAFLPAVRDLASNDDLEADLKGALGATLGAVAVAGALVLVLWRYVLTASERAAKFIEHPASEAMRGSMREVSDELYRLIRQATGGKRRIVVFVDDLERCRPPRAVQVCEAASNLLAHTDVVTVLLADMRVIASSAEIQYRRLESLEENGEQPSGAYGRLYLQKIVQIQFDLPPLRGIDAFVGEQVEVGPGPAEGARQNRLPLPVELALSVAAVVAMVASGVYFAVWQADAGDRGAAFVGGALAGAFVLFVFGLLLKGAARLLRFAVGAVQRRAARRRLKSIDASITDRASKAATPKAVEESFGDLTEDEAKLVGDRVVRFFTHESHLQEEAIAGMVAFLPNIPRSAKRMLNHLRLQLYLAIKRGLLEPGSELTPSHVGKWVVLEQRWPELAQDLVGRRGATRELEQATVGEAADVGSLGETLERLKLDAAPSEELLSFLATEPKLGSVVDQLVFLEPASR
jgi:hypothetical protein